MSLTDYLAANYLTADSRPSSKKRKRKEPKAGLSIANDDLNGWEDQSTRQAADDPPTTIAGHSSAFRATKTSTFKTIGAAVPSHADQTAADAILASAAVEQKSREDAVQDDDMPAMVDANGDDVQEPTMSSGAGAGLQSAATVTAALEKRAADERRRFEADPRASGKGQETIYRDASGRIINVAIKRAEARQAADAAARQKEADKEDLKGDVQKVARERRRRDVQDAKYLGLARYADDEDMNEELKETERWNDPAAGFVTKKKEGKSVSGKPLYKGAAAPNRYGIRPGHRWDGVDRGNGFEKEYFAKKNERESIKNLRYQWEMDE